MNSKLILKIIGKCFIILAILLLFPSVVALLYGEEVYPFLIPFILSIFIGLILIRIKPNNTTLYAKDGFVIVTFVWIVFSIFGAMPFYISEQIPRYIDALFETVSGLTTTGSSVVNDVESMSYGCLYWRSFTHFIGGMGVLVFVMAILPLNEQHSMHIMRAEVPGPEVGKLVPKAKETAKILYSIYIAFTILETILLKFGGMSWFDSLLHAFGTAGTGGFSTKNSSIAYFNSQYIETVIGIFLILFGVNFNLYFFILKRNFKLALRSEELRIYLIIITISVLLIGFAVNFRDAFFYVSSIITTAGFCTVDYTQWPVFCQLILVILMFIGACAGSTGGGLKVSRIIILFKASFADILHTISPRRYIKIRLENSSVSNEIINSVYSFTVLYFIILFISTLLISLNSFNFETSFSACLSCLSNIGPGLSLIGPTGNFSIFSDFSKFVLIIDMILGRLEIYPILSTVGLLIKMKKINTIKERHTKQKKYTAP